MASEVSFATLMLVHPEFSSKLTNRSQFYKKNFFSLKLILLTNKDSVTIPIKTLLTMTLLITIINVALHIFFYLVLEVKSFISKISSKYCHFK